MGGFKLEIFDKSLLYYDKIKIDSYFHAFLLVYNSRMT